MAMFGFRNQIEVVDELVVRASDTLRSKGRLLLSLRARPIRRRSLKHGPLHRLGHS